ncbi:MAG TPA: S8 family peptidase [Polyangiaceae bacterium]|nr:S8 family peptidase [Polyangiaceae bacterium]
MTKSLLGKNFRKLQPKIRMCANGSSSVNARRAERSACVAIDEKAPISKEVRPTRAALRSTRGLTVEAASKARERAKLERLADDVRISVFVQTTASVDDREASSEPQNPRRGNLETRTVSLAELPGLLERKQVMHVELGEPIAKPTPKKELPDTQAPPVTLRKVAGESDHRDGAGVLVGIIDVEGFDFSHPDFLNPDGTTRFVSIWDQGGTTRPPPSQLGYARGSEILQKHMNAALAASSKQRVPPTELEPQSQMAESAHGTHVASIAAGNLGVCRKADIAAVLLSIPEDELSRRGSFYDSTRIAHAVEYLLKLADERDQPIVINVSLGTNGHAHDGSAAISRWIDSAMSQPGRCIAVAAGNAGQEVAAFEGDTGYVMGRIHTSGKVAGNGLVTDIDWVVVGNSILDVSENELELWFCPEDRVEVSVKPPTGEWIGPIAPRQYVENRQLADGGMISIYNELYHPANGANYVSIYLSPHLQEPVIGVQAGRWVVRLHGLDIRDGEYHGWIERDDPRPVGRAADRVRWNFPSFFGERSNVDNSSVTSLACGLRVVCVANLDADNEVIAISSSQGPTRDGRFKPDVAAPGVEVLAANGFASGGRGWIRMTGTSMATPYVTGVMGLMLAVNRDLTAAQIEGIIHRTSRPLPGGGFGWVNGAGFGAIVPTSCIEEARFINDRKDVTKRDDDGGAL